MTNSTLVFESEAVANTLVAGIPCAVRSFLAASDAGLIDPYKKQLMAVPGGWRDFGSVAREMKRIDPEAPVTGVPLEVTEADAVIDAADCLENLANLTPVSMKEFAESLSDTGDSGASLRLEKASRRIIAETGKPTDGFVSRYINRPISQYCSFHLLKLDWIRPIHATILASAFGVVMALCLFLGGHTGLIAGAVLFQLASIIDGVDGEIARATFRTSRLGATLDTASDAATNFAFIAGVSANLWMRGDAAAGQAGLAGLALLMTGLAALGFLSVREGGPLSFDALKHDANAASSPVMSLLAKITSRDVYALVLAVLILIGLAGPAMIFFAAATTIWFIAAVIMLGRRFFRTD